MSGRAANALSASEGKWLVCRAGPSSDPSDYRPGGRATGLDPGRRRSKITLCCPIGCVALNRKPLFPKLPAIDHFNRMCAAMDFNPIATPVRLANGEVHIHACIHHSLPNFVGHA
ncbi:hypothetical protein IE4803_CH01207 [Rhizobium etli bv. phaseoli str. IE4803]|nr:hypothetical protein IE4803_CH01207 [Rhizobium etli bv. phaseoli str. IE4803]